MNSSAADNNGGRRRSRSQSQNRGRARRNSDNAITSGSRATSANPSNRNNEGTEQERDEFIASFQLNMLSTSSPILLHNGIRKLGNKCYSAKMIRRYFENSNPHNVNIRIVQIWNVHNKGHYAQFMQKNYNDVDNMLLWHGTTRKNLVNILQNSLMLPVVATNGHMFGPGIYFADRMSKSSHYTDQSGPEVFLLCQVALGKKWRVYQAEKFTKAPGDFDTLKAVGKYVPDSGGQEMLGKYCKIPCGRTVTHRDTSAWSKMVLNCNEYIVFEQDRIRIKFIVHCERSSSSSSMPTSVLQTVRAVVPATVSQRATPLAQNVIVRKPLASTVRAPAITAPIASSSALINSQRNNVSSTRPTTASTTASTIRAASSNATSYTVTAPKPLASATSFYNTGATSSYIYNLPNSSRFSTIRSSNLTSTNSRSYTTPLLTGRSGSSSSRTASYPNYNYSTLRNPASSYSSPRSQSDECCSCCVIL